jgi:hypothetical protein
MPMTGRQNTNNNGVLLLLLSRAVPTASVVQPLLRRRRVLVAAAVVSSTAVLMMTMMMLLVILPRLAAAAAGAAAPVSADAFVRNGPFCPATGRRRPPSSPTMPWTPPLLLSLPPLVPSSSSSSQLSLLPQPLHRAVGWKHERQPAATGTDVATVRVAQRLATTTATTSRTTTRMLTRRSHSNSSNDNDGNGKNKFGMAQRIDSIKSGIVGAVVGSIGQAPVSALHQIVVSSHGSSNSNGLAQFEYDTDAAAVAGALFAIVYRYCIRQDSENRQLNQGAVGAFAIVRTCGAVRIPPYCTALPLHCGAPLGYADWNVLQQLLWSGTESLVLFGVTALVMDAAMSKGYISQFPG